MPSLGADEKTTGQIVFESLLTHSLANARRATRAIGAPRGFGIDFALEAFRQQGEARQKLQQRNLREAFPAAFQTFKPEVRQMPNGLNGTGMAMQRFTRGGLPVTPIRRGVPRAPSQRDFEFDRNADGSLRLFTASPDGGFVELPPGNKPGELNRRGIPVWGIRINVSPGGGFGGQTFVQIKPSPRRTNPLNFKALMRAERRIDKFEKTIKRFFKCETAGQRLRPKKRRMVRRKKKRKR